MGRPERYSPKVTHRIMPVAQEVQLRGAIGEEIMRHPDFYMRFHSAGVENNDEHMIHCRASGSTSIPQEAALAALSRRVDAINGSVFLGVRELVAISRIKSLNVAVLETVKQQGSVQLAHGKSHVLRYFRVTLATVAGEERHVESNEDAQRSIRNADIVLFASGGHY
jgi:hypothetical protein